MDELHYLVSTEHQWKDEYPGPNFSMTGDVSGLYGDCTYFTGDVTGLIGDCTGLSGDCTGIIGDLDSIPRPQFKYKWFGNYVTEVEVDG
mgnify:CR=1 FL=1|tara:strand:- start:3341 stop:3607 length:267 start_codon:yes stop_codon:yes gene_type:complete